MMTLPLGPQKCYLSVQRKYTGQSTHLWRKHSICSWDHVKENQNSRHSLTFKLVLVAVSSGKVLLIRERREEERKREKEQ